MDLPYQAKYELFHKKREHPRLNKGLLSSPIQIILPPTHEFEATGRIENAEYIGSYNRVDNDDGTIIVPGSPRLWTNPPLPYTLLSYADRQISSAHRHLSPSGLLPLMEAVDAVGKKIEWPAIDFVTNRNSLRKLMGWVRHGSKHTDFRIDIELAGKRTILFNTFQDHGDNTFPRSYGESFECVTTAPAPGCERSICHHRIIKYDFFGLKMIVRFEVDACLPSDELDTTKLCTLIDSSAALDVAPGVTSGQGTRIIHAGSEVPQHSLIELKSSHQSKPQWSTIFPQLYFSQTPWIFVGIHENGTFSEVKVKSTSMVEMEALRNAFESCLQRLGQILKTIQKVSIARGTKKHLSLVCRKGELYMYERVSRKSCLPRDILARFDAD